MHSKGYVVAVCGFVKSHLTPGALVCRENAATYSVGNKGQNICGVFSETAPLQRLSAPPLDGHTSGLPFFLQRARMHIVHMLVLEPTRTVHDVMLPTTQLP